MSSTMLRSTRSPISVIHFSSSFPLISSRSTLRVYRVRPPRVECKSLHFSTRWMQHHHCLHTALHIRLMLRLVVTRASSYLSSRVIRPLVLSSSVTMASGSNQGPKIQVDKNELKKRLTPEQYHVTQEQGTEAPWSGEYLKLKDNGWYSCIVCDADLFPSNFKYESGCGWPSFYDVDKSKLIFKPDHRHGRTRTEVTCANCDAHLGHVFEDGPAPTGTRYCINSVCLKFKKKDAPASQ